MKAICDLGKILDMTHLEITDGTGSNTTRLVIGRNPRD
jgi:hypothetical protein